MIVSLMNCCLKIWSIFQTFETKKKKCKFSYKIHNEIDFNVHHRSTSVHANTPLSLQTLYRALEEELYIIYTCIHSILIILFRTLFPSGYCRSKARRIVFISLLSAHLHLFLYTLAKRRVFDVLFLIIILFFSSSYFYFAVFFVVFIYLYESRNLCFPLSLKFVFRDLVYTLAEIKAIYIHLDSLL